MFNIAILAMTLASLQISNSSFVKPVNLPDDAITYEELRYYALYDCDNNESPSPALVGSLIEIEKSFNPPPSMRGMLLAAACMESGYNPNAKGDKKFSQDKKTPMAIGILQQWSFYEKSYGINRTDPFAAATSWMQHIVRQIPKVKKLCKYKTEKRIWLAAWVTGIRSKKKNGRCNETPKHYRLLKHWHKNIKQDRKFLEDYEPRAKDGRGC
jgi:hypothetical protein